MSDKDQVNQSIESIDPLSSLPEEVLKQKVSDSPINEGIDQSHAYSYIQLIKLLAIMKITKVLFEEALPAMQDSIYKDRFLKAGAQMNLKADQELTPYWEEKLKEKAMSMAKVSHMASVKAEWTVNQLYTGILDMYGTRFTESVDPIVESINEILDLGNKTKVENAIPLIWEECDPEFLSNANQHELMLAFVPGSKEAMIGCYLDDNNVLRKLELNSSSVFRTLPTLISKTNNLLPLRDVSDFMDVFPDEKISEAGHGTV